MKLIADALRAAGHHPWFVHAIKAAAPLEKRLNRISGGRLQLAVGQPLIMLTTVGRRSGLERTVPLLYARDGDDYVVVASNMGQERHPAWMYNLKATPKATLTDRGRTVEVTAVLADEDTRERVWPKVVSVYPAYDTYVARASHRDIQVFVLKPNGADAAAATTGANPAVASEESGSRD